MVVNKRFINDQGPIAYIKGEAQRVDEYITLTSDVDIWPVDLPKHMKNVRFIGYGTIIEGDVRIGDGTWIGHYCILEGFNAPLSIGKACSISNCVQIYTHDTSYRTINRDKYEKQIAPVIIGDYVQIGAGVIILKGVIVGDHSIIGAGSVVMKDVKPWTLVAGIPAKKKKDLQ